MQHQAHEEPPPPDDAGRRPLGEDAAVARNGNVAKLTIMVKSPTEKEIFFYMRPSAKFGKLFEAYRNTIERTMILFYNGKKLNHSQTPKQIGMQGPEVIIVEAFDATELNRLLAEMNGKAKEIQDDTYVRRHYLKLAENIEGWLMRNDDDNQLARVTDTFQAACWIARNHQLCELKLNDALKAKACVTKELTDALKANEAGRKSQELLANEQTKLAKKLKALQNQLDQAAKKKGKCSNELVAQRDTEITGFKKDLQDLQNVLTAERAAHELTERRDERDDDVGLVADVLSGAFEKEAENARLKEELEKAVQREQENARLKAELEKAVQREEENARLKAELAELQRAQLQMAACVLREQQSVVDKNAEIEQENARLKAKLAGLQRAQLEQQSAVDALARGELNARIYAEEVRNIEGVLQSVLRRSDAEKTACAVKQHALAQLLQNESQKLQGESSEA